MGTMDSLVAVVTGGASGIGAAIGRRLAAEGATIAVFDVNPDAADPAFSAYRADISDRQSVQDAIAQVVADTDDPAERVIEFVRVFEEGADDLMSAQSSCLYVSVLTERGLVERGTSSQITAAIVAWREAIADLLRAALPPDSDLDAEALADHVFVTFEGAFILCRATGDPGHMRRQLGALRRLFEVLLVQGAA